MIVPLDPERVAYSADQSQASVLIPEVHPRSSRSQKPLYFPGKLGDFSSSLLTSDAQGLPEFPRAPHKPVRAYNELLARNYTAPHKMSTGGPPLTGPYDIAGGNIAECDDCGLVAIEALPAVPCRGWMIKGDCPNGCGSVVKVIYCGREWCSRCGAPLSETHVRRIARLKPKVMQMSRMGMLVIEFPDRFRKIPGWAYSAGGLKLAGNAILDVVAGRRTKRGPRTGGYFDRGWWRWHWFGDQMAGKWNPHANVIFDAGYLPESTLESLKADLRRELKCRDLIVHYSYRRTEGEMLHTLRYVTRSTFLNEQWDPYMAAQLYRFINVHRWGKWDGPCVWTSAAAQEYVAIEKLERGICPDCDAHLKWGRKPLPAWMFENSLRAGWVKPIGGGYYRLKVPQNVEQLLKWAEG